MKKSKVIISVIVMLSLMSIYIPNVMAEEEDSKFMPFTVGVSDTPQNVDPANAYDSVSYDTLNQVYEGLYTYNLSSPAMESIPLLAKEMGNWSADNLNLTIALREDVLFHDNTTFNATDVKWNFDRIFYFAEEQRSDPYTLYYNGEKWGDGTPQLIVNETIIVDEFTIKFVLNKAFGIWDKMLAFTGSSIIKPNPAFEKEFLTLSDPAVGTGPFKLTAVEPDQYVTMEKFDDYYSGPANISKIYYSVIKDGEVASTAMLNHELHYGGVLAEHLAEAEADPDITIERVKTTVVFYLQLGYHTLPHAVRKAMQFGWNYTYYLEETLQGEAYELHTPIPDGMEFYNPDIEGLPYYNKTMARQFLIDDQSELENPVPAGLTATSPDSEWEAVATGDNPLFTSNFTRYTSTGLEKIKTQLIDNYADIGIKVVDWHIGDWGTWTEWSQTPGNKALLDISMGGWGPDYNDAINMIEPIFKTNATYNTAQINETDLDDLMDANFGITDTALRQASFDEIVTKLIVDYAPCFYIYQRGGREVYNNKYVSNIQDMLNVFDNTYWYNVEYIPQPVPGIPGFTLGYMLIACLGAVSLVIFAVKKRH
ncbi:ABC transporter substrate-binding protein [Promethearchaeum syntrophicum]|uniref:ABC transporter substrate-binding protein n=1 Tax=Promethearchaeum syntrophicum TaxID=2594042 RepID=A0A5B9DDE1_9ARCH|nr:ABC transporter substrate-binding protein [Candidatus Prometheoarchaeum syntrophicum]QEE17258.1 Bacterial extracellular solute-binding proteins, family 5 Middle [Candidatus Prometheoarchaeum syntrophicum]